MMRYFIIINSKDTHFQVMIYISPQKFSGFAEF